MDKIVFPFNSLCFVHVGFHVLQLGKIKSKAGETEWGSLMCECLPVLYTLNKKQFEMHETYGRMFIWHQRSPELSPGNNDAILKAENLSAN